MKSDRQEVERKTDRGIEKRAVRSGKPNRRERQPVSLQSAGRGSRRFDMGKRGLTIWKNMILYRYTG